jgi:hypothetical protein
MDFREFLADGIATRAPIKRDFQFAGKHVTGFFLDLPALQVRELLKADVVDRDALFLSAVVCDAQGGPLLTIDQARTLKAQQMNALLTEAFSALGLTSDGREEAKKP